MIKLTQFTLISSYSSDYEYIVIAQIKTIFNSKTVFDSAVYLFLFILCFISFWSDMNSFRTIFQRSMWTSTNTNWSVQIQSPYGCLSLNELFNQNIINQHLLKWIKYYRLPCQQRFDLICFYSFLPSILEIIYLEAHFLSLKMNFLVPLLCGLFLVLM